MLDRVIGNYRIVQKLGQGGMGVVYRAIDTRLDRTVAIKFLSKQLSDDPVAQKRFLHEARAASSIEHNHIVTIHDIGETDDGQLYIVMAYYDGESLEKRIEGGRLSVGEAVCISSEIADGLDALHQREVTHRDIKPGNIILAENGQAKVVDFGLAHLQDSTKLTQTGTTVGTLSYMAPEQITNGPVDGRADVYALGVILYELLTGMRPFRGEHAAAITYAIVNETQVPVREISPEVTAELSALVDRALAKKPEDRFASAGDMRDALQAVVPTSTPSAPRYVKQKPLWQRASLAVSLVVVVLAAVLVYRLLPFGVPAEAAEMVLAVVDFRDLRTTPDPVFPAGMSGLVHVGLVEVAPCRVVSPEHLYDVRRRLFGSGGAAIGPEEALAVAREAGATLVLSGQRIGDLPDGVVTYQLIETKTGNTLHAGRIEEGSLAAMADGIISSVVPALAKASGTPNDVAPVPVRSLTSNVPESYREYVLGTVALGQFSKDAATHFLRAIELDSTFALAYFDLARSYYSGKAPSGLDKDAAHAYAGAAWRHRARMSTRDRLRLRAWRSSLDGNVVDATKQYRDILQTWPDDKTAMRALCKHLMFFWEVGEAGRVAGEGLRMYPDDLELAEVYAWGCSSTGRFEEALRWFRRVAEQRNWGNDWDNLGLQLLTMGEPDSAEVVFRHALEVNPSLTGLNYSLALCNYHRGDVPATIRALKAIAAEYPEVRIADDLALMYAEAGQFEAAVAVCRERPRSTPYELSRSAMYEMRMLLLAGRFDAALDLQADIQWEGSFAHTAIATAALALACMDSLDAAARMIEEASPSDRTGIFKYFAMRTRATIQCRRGQFAEALETLNELEHMGVSRTAFLDPPFRTLRAQAYAGAGQPDRAEAEYLELLRIYPAHAVGYYELGRFYQGLDRGEDARDAYHVFLELWANADEGRPETADALIRLAQLDATP